MKHTKTAVLTLALTLAPLGAAAEPPAERVQASEQARGAAPAPPARLGSKADESRYAAKEARSADAKDYRGGDVVVISASTLAIILAIILIIVLI